MKSRIIVRGKPKQSAVNYLYRKYPDSVIRHRRYGFVDLPVNNYRCNL